MVKCSNDTDKAHISEFSATVIVVLLSLQYHCPPNLELHQHLSRACAGQFLVYIKKKALKSEKARIKKKLTFLYRNKKRMKAF